MLATQDVYDLEVPDEDTRSRGERLIDRAKYISMMQLLFAREAAEFARDRRVRAGWCRYPDRLDSYPLPPDRPAGRQLCGSRRAR